MRWGDSPPHTQQRGVLFPRARAGSWRRCPRRRIPASAQLAGSGAAESRRRRLSATTHSALPLEHGKSRGSGRRGDTKLASPGIVPHTAAGAVRACAESEVFPNSGAAQAAGCARLRSRRRSGCCPTPGGWFLPGEVTGREQSPRGTPAGGGRQGEGRPGSRNLLFAGAETKRGRELNRAAEIS